MDIGFQWTFRNEYFSEWILWFPDFLPYECGIVLWLEEYLKKTFDINWGFNSFVLISIVLEKFERIVFLWRK